MENTNTVSLLKSLESTYLDKKYDETYNMFLKNKGLFDSGIYHYNLGTLHLKQANYAVGRFHLEKSLKDGFINIRSVNNLKYSLEKLNLTEEGNNSPLDGVVQKSLEVSSLSYLTVSLSLVLLILFLYKLKIIRRFSILIFLLIISATPFIISKLYLESKTFAIVLKDTTLREGPSGVYPETKVLEAGRKIVVKELDNDYFLIHSPKEYTGWIKKFDIGLY